MKELKPEWDELREFVWEWDPIGVRGARKNNPDEYECLIEHTLPLLQSRATVDEIKTDLDEFLPNHFGLRPQATATEFAEKCVRWWRSGKSQEWEFG